MLDVLLRLVIKFIIIFINFFFLYLAAQRVEIALSRTMTAQERSDASIEASERAKDDADTARIYCAQFDPNFRQPGNFFFLLLLSTFLIIL